MYTVCTVKIPGNSWLLCRENEALWREVASLRQKHHKQQQIVNKVSFKTTFSHSLYHKISNKGARRGAKTHPGGGALSPTEKF